MMKKIIALIVWAAFMPALFVACRRPLEKRPNFIFILADDLGWTSHSYLMDQRYPESRSEYYETPNMDRLAASGMRCTNGYAPAAICTPSRRSIQFGQTPARLGDISFRGRYNPRTSQWLTIPRLLKSIDPAYRTAHYGKWDLRADMAPEDLGYDESDGNTGNKDGDVMTDKKTKWTAVHINEDPKKTVSVTDRAIGFIEKQSQAKNPFYLQVSYYATHVDIQTTDSAYRKYLLKTKGKVHDNAGFAGMLEELDKGIGRIMDKLKELGMEENTYIIYMADNGGVPLIPPEPVRKKMDHPGSFSKKMYNYPLRGGKWVLYEGGIRVPFIIWGPEVKEGVFCNVPVAGFDLIPTLSDLAGNTQSLPEYLEGGSLRPLFGDPEKGKVTRQQDAFYFHRYNNAYKHSAIIEGNYKLIKIWKNNTTELYDLQKDLGELHDISGEMPELAGKLERKLMTYLEKVHSEALYPPPADEVPDKKKK